jgi:sugar O-acyltransferase (sialic acid O-acetyltransferase NeuD family)
VATDSIIIKGAGGHARVVIDCARAQGRTVECAYDPFNEGELYGIPVRSNYNSVDFPKAAAVVAIGDNAVRRKVSANVLHSFTNVIHPSAMISSFASIGEGNMILHGSIVQAAARIGNHVILNTGSQVDHDCVISDFVHIAPGVILCGNVHVGEGSFIGTGAIVIPGKKIGAWSIIGAGSVVIDNIPDNVIAVGNPAKVIKHWKPELIT